MQDPRGLRLLHQPADADTDGWGDSDWQDFVLAAGNANVEDDPSLASTQWGSPDISPGTTAEGTGAVPSGCDSNDYIGAVDPAGDHRTPGSSGRDSAASRWASASSGQTATNSRARGSFTRSAVVDTRR